jgi:glycosyltransferase involved in cell wall biosynthesis
VADEKISVVYNAVNKSFKPLYNDLDLQNETYFLAVSSLNYRKNLLSVLQAFDAITIQNKDVKLYLIGDLDTKSFTKVNIDHYLNNKQIKALGRVSDEELIQYYSNAKGFVYPSLYEGFGIPPLEAQNCACPVLVSDVSSLPEVFKDSVLYCNPLSVDSLQVNMLKLLEENTRKSLQMKGAENIKRFSWEQSANNIINIIKHI